VTTPECRASISGNCLQVTHGFTLCREGECDEEVIDQIASAARASAAEPPRRRVRRPVTEAEYAASLPGRAQKIADELSELLPEGMRFEWTSPEAAE
jgi:hypothetical protein